jgi:extracellular factor (EF) 3-hydroxypalmitic acid methyl ester biosynthesis protein
LSEEFIEELESPLLGRLGEQFAQFEMEASQIPEDEITSHKSFIQRDLHPLLLRSPFIYRSFQKPLGYAGDYEMVNMILGEPRQGTSTYSKIINKLFLEGGPPKAHRNRIDELVKALTKAVEQADREGRQLRVLNVGCGPAVEIQRFIRTHPLADRCEFRLVDFNEETLNYTKSKIDEAIKDSGRKPKVEFVHQSVNSLLKQAAQRKGTIPTETFDFVYCAGLFDYLSDRVCSRMLELFYRWAKPNGTVLVTNVHPSNTGLYIMEYLMEWHLIYRNERELLNLAPKLGRHEVYGEETGQNIILEINKTISGDG